MNVHWICQHHCRRYLPPKRTERKGSFDVSGQHLNKLKSLKFRIGKRRPTVSNRVGQYFEPLKTVGNDNNNNNNNNNKTS